MTEADGAPGELERRVLAESGLVDVRFSAQSGGKLEGARRPLRVPLHEPRAGEGADDRGAYLELAFGLPPGSYATCVTREVCKSDEYSEAGG
jgi:tRNA pseudouridine13 synthase